MTTTIRAEWGHRSACQKAARLLTDLEKRTLTRDARDRILMQLGALLEPKVEEWIT